MTIQMKPIHKYVDTAIWADSDFYLLNPFPHEEDAKFHQGERDWSLGISAGLRGHVVEPLCEVNILKRSKESQY